MTAEQLTTEYTSKVRVSFGEDLLDEFMNNQCDKCGITNDAKTTIKDVLDNHSSYRQKVGDNVDMMWMVTLPQSAKEFMGLVGDRLKHAFAMS